MATQTSVVSFHHSFTKGFPLDTILPKQGESGMFLPTGVEFDMVTKIWTININLLTPQQLSAKKIVIFVDDQISGRRPLPYILDFSQILRRNSIS